MLSKVGHKIFHKISNFGEFVAFIVEAMTVLIRFKFKFKIVVTEMIKLALIQFQL